MKSVNSRINQDHRLRPIMDKLMKSCEKEMELYGIEIEKYKNDPENTKFEIKEKNMVPLHRETLLSIRKYNRTQ